MIKKLLFVILFAVFLKADIDSRVINILGYSDYNTNKNLINYIFKDSNNSIDYVSLTEKLQNNGLLKLDLGSTQYINVTFTLSNSPKKSLDILKSSLKALGHYYYFPTEAIESGDSLRWSIKLKTAAAINPLRLSKELQDRNCKVVDIIREGSTSWNYSIDTSNCDVYKYENLVDNRELNLKKSLKPYMIKISDATAIRINSYSGNRWYPNVVFYDNDLNILGNFKETSLQSNLKLDVPNNTKYIKIDDLYTLANIRRGLNITKE